MNAIQALSQLSYTPVFGRDARSISYIQLYVVEISGIEPLTS